MYARTWAARLIWAGRQSYNATGNWIQRRATRIGARNAKELDHRQTQLVTKMQHQALYWHSSTFKIRNTPRMRIEFTSSFLRGNSVALWPPDSGAERRDIGCCGMSRRAVGRAIPAQMLRRCH